MKSLSCTELVAIIVSGNSDDIGAAISNVEFGIPENGWSQEELLNCLIHSWKVVCARPTGAFQILFWFERSLRKLSMEQRARVREVVCESYGKTIEHHTTLEIAEWFGGFGSEEALKFIVYWFDRWDSMTDHQKKCLDGFFRETFEVVEKLPDKTLFDSLLALEARYDALCPRAPGATPRHGPVGPDAFWKR